MRGPPVKTKNKTLWKKTFDSSGRREADFSSLSGRPLEPLYSREDLDGIDAASEIGFPGDYPFTRGVHPSMYRGKLWTMRQFSGMGTADQTNERYKFLLEKGQTGLSVAFDNPTLYGRDSDHGLSVGEVGKTGVAVDTAADMERLFRDIPLDRVSTSMTINAPAAWIFAMFLANAENRGISFAGLRGTLQNDILKEYIAQKEWIFPPEPHMRLITDLMAFCADHVPQWNTISISGYHIREAGSTAAQELAFTLADGFAYVEYGMRAGLNVDDFAPRLSFFFNAHLDFFEEIAKMRAARRIWARHMKDKYGAKNPRSWLCRFHVQTAGCSLTAQQPEINIVRTALEALAGVLGGCQSLHTNSMDEALALPSEKAVEIALRTQQIIAFESGVANVIDPLGGSYYVEKLTRELEDEAEAYFRKIEEMGGIVGAIEQGFPQREITRAAYEYQMALSRKKKFQVGVNAFANPGETLEIPILEIEESVEKDQLAFLERTKAERDNGAVRRSLEALAAAAAGRDNLMPRLLDCSRVRVTVGEISDALAAVFGEYREQPFF
ncbi:MAG: methylmalonyl-CoA mutase family protein [Acidobacteriota bacterium]|nr:methylmalonyl-CoA mutase family protein [Acidobacteriota bacterium]